MDYPLSKVKEATPEIFKEFISLHDIVFQNTYYGGKEIINRLSSTNKLFVYKSEEALQGYVYVEANPKFQEGSIEFIAVSQNNRRKGIGENLLQEAVQYIFSVPQMGVLELCLNTNNEEAMRLYEKVGFKEKSCLRYYKIE